MALEAGREPRRAMREGGMGAVWFERGRWRRGLEDREGDRVMEVE